MNLQILKHNPKTIEKEIRILRRLGLNEEEIQYLILLRVKGQRSLKWNFK